MLTHARKPTCSPARAGCHLCTCWDVACRYKLCEDVDDDIERLRSKHKYRLAGSYTSAAQQVAAFSCINAFLSPLALLAGSNKAVEVLDVATLK